MSLVNDIQYRLSDQMGADRMTLQTVLFQGLTFGDAIPAIGNGLVNFKVVSPASKLQSVVAKIGGLATHVA